MVTNLPTDPPPMVYKMVTTPAACAVTMPEEAPTDAIEGLLLLHTPPEVLLVKVSVKPIHTLPDPVIGPRLAKADKEKKNAINVR